MIYLANRDAVKEKIKWGYAVHTETNGTATSPDVMSGGRIATTDGRLTQLRMTSTVRASFWGYIENDFNIFKDIMTARAFLTRVKNVNPTITNWQVVPVMGWTEEGNSSHYGPVLTQVVDGFTQADFDAFIDQVISGGYVELLLPDPDDLQ